MPNRVSLWPTPVHGWHSAQYARQSLVVDQSSKHARLSGAHHGGPEEGVELTDSPAIEWFVGPELDDRVQGLGDVLARPVVARVQGVPDLLQVIDVVHHHADVAG